MKETFSLEARVFFPEVHVSRHKLALWHGEERLLAHEQELEPCLVYVPTGLRRHACFTVRSVRQKGQDTTWKYMSKPGMVVHICNPSTGEAEARGLEVQD